MRKFGNVLEKNDPCLLRKDAIFNEQKCPLETRLAICYIHFLFLQQVFENIASKQTTVQHFIISVTSILVNICRNLLD